jgi:hypothetical protein
MTPQNFANHARWHPLYHFFALPVMLINVVWAIVVFVQSPGPSSGWWIVVSFALALLALYVRTNALKAQDRVIRLEETLRYRALSAALAEQCATLAPEQIIALRFAGDDELEELASATLAGKFAKPKEIKQAIKNWRADTMRV